MVDIRGIEKTPIYKTCFLRRNIIRLLQREIESIDYSAGARDLVALHGVLKILNQEIKLIGDIKGEFQIRIARL